MNLDAVRLLNIMGSINTNLLPQFRQKKSSIQFQAGPIQRNFLNEFLTTRTKRLMPTQNPKTSPNPATTPKKVQTRSKTTGTSVTFFKRNTWRKVQEFIPSSLKTDQKGSVILPRAAVTKPKIEHWKSQHRQPASPPWNPAMKIGTLRSLTNLSILWLTFKTNSQSRPYLFKVQSSVRLFKHGVNPRKGSCKQPTPREQDRRLET